MQYRKKPVVIEAIRFGGSNHDEIFRWAGWDMVIVKNDRSVLVIPTLEGDMTASAGDWIIKGIKGEFYPCKPDIFAATYDPV
jgi:hypothetical protein